MKSLASLCCVLWWMFGGMALQAQGAAADSAEIRASGTATRSIRPNRAAVTFQFNVVDSTPALAGAKLAARADSVRRALMAIGIPRDSLVTGSRWYWWPGRIEVIQQSRCIRTADPRVGCIQVMDTAYRTRESIEVRMHDIDLVGRVIDAALDHGITEISPIQFSATDVRLPQEEVLREATIQARRQAEIIATASGGRLGRVLTLSTSADNVSRYGGLSEIVTTATAIRSSGAGTEITAPSVVVTVTVYGRWRLEPSP